jgi:hypothetical protein
MKDMVTFDPNDSKLIITRLHEQAERDAIRLTLHAHQEMVDEDISYQQVQEVLQSPLILENYSEHKRGPCCLVCRQTGDGRFVHVVCTTSLEIAIIITVYEPKPPKWITPFERGKRI